MPGFDYEKLRAECKACSCARCGASPTRIGVDVEDDGTVGAEESLFVADVLCHGCFEKAPHRFKVTHAQNVYRAAIKAGSDERFARRAAEVAGHFTWEEC